MLENVFWTSQFVQTAIQIQGIGERILHIALCRKSYAHSISPRTRVRQCTLPKGSYGFNMLESALWTLHLVQSDMPNMQGERRSGLQE